jgi:hypothetical protein
MAISSGVIAPRSRPAGALSLARRRLLVCVEGHNSTIIDNNVIPVTATNYAASRERKRGDLGQPAATNDARSAMAVAARHTAGPNKMTALASAIFPQAPPT